MTGRAARRQDEGRPTEERPRGGRTDGRRGRRRRSAPVKGSESTVQSTKREMKGSTRRGQAGGESASGNSIKTMTEQRGWGGQEDS